MSNHGVFCASSTEAEAISLHEAIQILQHVISKSYCTITVDVMNSNTIPLDEFDDVFFFGLIDLPVF